MEINTFSDQQYLRKFIGNRPALEVILMHLKLKHKKINKK